MIIAASAVSLRSEHTAIEAHQRRETLTVWQGREEPRVTGNSNGPRLDVERELAALQRDKVSLRHNNGMKLREVQPADLELSEDQEMEKDLKMRLLRQLFERMTGRKFRIIDPSEFNGGKQLQSATAKEATAQAEASVPESGDGYGLIYDYRDSHYEYEKTQVQAGGVITTGDGRQIDFSLSVSMSREFYSEQNFQLRAGDALKDPLVVNFSGTAAQLTGRDFAFDIDADGSQDQIAFVSPGSGFLALDNNEDGIINDGSELFGALSGDGFADLSQYDDDGNMWIDENDSIYNRLRIWTKNSTGEDQLLALVDVGVGAIYLGHVESQFSVKNEENSLLGQVQSTGLAMMESGQMVSVQQLDLVA